MRKLLAAAVITLGLLALLGASKGGTYQGGTYGTAGASYQAGGVAAVDTVKIKTYDIRLPNRAAETAGYVYADSTKYDVLNSGVVGAVMKWGAVTKANSTADSNVYTYPSPDYTLTARGGRAEDDDNSDAPYWFTMVWVSANGLTNGDRIESAYLMFNPSAYGGMTVPAGEYIACRLDTISTDYRITARHLNGRFRSSWAKIDSVAQTGWTPTLGARYDRHDWGPRSNNVIGPGTYAVGTVHRLDVTDAVQQASDNGTLGRGLLFMIYGSDGVGTFTLSAGTSLTYCGTASGDNGGKGLPVFTAVSTSRRGPRPWNGAARVPVAVVFDDQYPVQSSYFTAMEAGGKQFDIAAFQTAVASYSWVDSLYALKPNYFGLIHHGRTHDSFGTLTAGQLFPELTRNWFPDEFTGLTAADTLGIVDSAWPYGAATPRKSVTAASMLRVFGYRACRGYGGSWTAGDVGLEYEPWLSWSGWTNVYNYRGTLISTLMGAPSIADEIGDYVDLAYTNYGKAALIFYGHRNTTAPADGITPAKLTALISATDALNSCEIMPLEDIVALRLSGATFGTPQYASFRARLSATVDSVAIRKTAAIMDSLYDASSDPNLLQMWIGPK